MTEWEWLKTTKSDYVAQKDGKNRVKRFNGWNSRASKCPTCLQLQAKLIEVKIQGQPLAKRNDVPLQSTTVLPRIKDPLWICLWSMDTEEFQSWGALCTPMSGSVLSRKNCSDACPTCRTPIHLLFCQPEEKKTNKPVVDNPAAVGQFIEKIYHVSFWPSLGSKPPSRWLAAGDPEDTITEGVKSDMSLAMVERLSWLRVVNESTELSFAKLEQLDRQWYKQHVKDTKHSVVQFMEAQEHLTHDTHGKPDTPLVQRNDTQIQRSLKGGNLTELMVSPLLSVEERLVVHRRYEVQMRLDSRFAVSWWIASTWKLDRYEAWLECERAAMLKLLRLGVPLGDRRVAWSERRYNLSTRGFENRTLECTLEKGNVWVVGYNSLEHTWMGQADAHGRVTVTGWERVTDLFVRVHKARTVVLRERLLPKTLRMLQLAGNEVFGSDEWHRYTQQAVLTLSVGVAPSIWREPRGPSPTTDVVNVPTTCPMPARESEDGTRTGPVGSGPGTLSESGLEESGPETPRAGGGGSRYSGPGGYFSLEHFCTIHRVTGSVEEESYNATNMTDGGKMYLESAELPTRAWLAKQELDRPLMAGEADRRFNNWSQCKLKDNRREATSRFALDVELALESGQWLDPNEEYIPVLPGYRVWDPSGYRRGALELPEGGTSQSILRVWHHSVRDLCLTVLEQDTVVLSACGQNEEKQDKSSYTVVWPDVELPVGEVQRAMARFTQRRLELTFGKTFASHKIEDMIDLTSGPYADSGGGGGARFIYDDKRKEFICDACKRERKEGICTCVDGGSPCGVCRQRKYVLRAIRCRTGQCRRMAEHRPKLPWAALDARTDELRKTKDWTQWVMQSSVWAEKAEPCLLIQHMSANRLAWRKSKKIVGDPLAPGHLWSPIMLSDPRVFAIERFLAPFLGPKCQISKLLVHRQHHNPKPFKYTGEMQRNTAWCLNRKNPQKAQHIHKRQSFFHLIQRRDYKTKHEHVVCRINDYACSDADKEYKKTKSSTSTATATTGGVSSMKMIGKGEKRKREEEYEDVDKDVMLPLEPVEKDVPIQLEVLLFY